MQAFWASFWPNFASTVLGLLLGLPLALWTDRRIRSRSFRLAHQADIQLLQNALEAILEAINYNIAALNKLLATFKENKVALALVLDCSTWDAVKADVMRLLHQPQLQRRVAFHFARIEYVGAAYAAYVDNLAGAVAAIHRLHDGSSPPLGIAYREKLPPVIEDVLRDANFLAVELTNLQRTLK